MERTCGVCDVGAELSCVACEADGCNAAEDTTEWACATYSWVGAAWTEITEEGVSETCQKLATDSDTLAKCNRLVSLSI